MDLMQRRRQLMAMQTVEKWDYVLTPDENGYIPCQEIMMTAGTNVTIVVNLSERTDSSGCLDVIFCGNALEQGRIWYIDNSKLNVDQTHVIQPTASKNLYVMGYYGNVGQNLFKANYCKIRIE